jgi:hypothetical protein
MFQSDDQNPYSSAYDEPGPQSLEVTGDVRPTVISAGDVLNHAWDMFKRHWGTLVGAFVIVFIINLVHGIN